MVLSKEAERLGIQRILPMNQPLMSRHLWELLRMNKASIWVCWVLQYRFRRKSVWTVGMQTGSWGIETAAETKRLYSCFY